ncbi:histidine kinase [Mycobacterium florentinum]|uniref:histidine kinase n=1 Tax=Mycobacterium florentinum TaxID=292462 RepID=A0A1X1UI90_MYCFL|nr:CHASE3 domain-containing protein [Mycobacterium florentinum]MCV7409367.1 CHASE3 domain-containing protein [Mycobacterium florentinum]ORV56542.1 histidine kinase [Mycobacterium florentinum]BBX78435.1 histidine kinase [Mycobacterium florentinum]
MISDTHPRAQLTVRGWLFVVLFSMGVLVLAGAVVGAVLLNRTDTVARGLSEQVEPARRSAIQLQAALRDQETGVRGYAIAADRQFLTPYYDGQHAEHAAAEEMRRLLGGRVDLINDLDAIERAAANWRASSAEPLIASVTPNAPNLVNSRVADRGKAEFDHLRELFDTQNTDFAAVSAQANDELKDITAWRDRVLGAVVLVFFGLAIALGLLTRRAITLPLASLAASCRRITEGNFTETITPPRRPKDIHDMAIDVENMRQRIVSALDVSRAAGARLDEQAIELKRSNAELEQFAYVASHDLQEPLRKVASFCQLLEKRYGDQLDERGIEYIGYAVDGAKRMQVLINDLLTFSRVGRVGSKQTELDLDSTLDAAVANLAVAIEESNTEIVRPGRPLPRIVGDPTLLTMLWQNLIGNAIKFRHVDRSPRIVIDCELRPDTHEWLLTVSDNGIGIAEEFTEKVFVIFQRLHGRGVYPGTGVGLALVKKIIEYHDGAVRIDTSYTDGTRFEFTLPVAANVRHPAALEGARQ